MKKLITAILLIGAFASCRAPKVIEKTVIEYKDSTVYRDTVIYKDVPIFVEGKTTTLKDTLPSSIPKTATASGKVKNKNTTASYNIKNGTIEVECNEEAYQDTIQDLRINLQNKERYITNLTSKETVKEVPVIKHKMPPWSIWYTAITGTAIVGAIGFLLYKKGWLGKIGSGFGKLFRWVIKLVT